MQERHIAKRIEKKISKRLSTKIHKFQEFFEINPQDNILDFNEVLEITRKFFFKKEAEITYAIDETSKREIYTLTNCGKKITVVSDPLNKTIEGREDPRIGIYGGEISTPEAGITIYPTRLKYGNKQLNSTIITGIVRAIVHQL